ncbi:S-acyl fatty acid synthase thioesterase, medium chain isoform X2 [Scyliorhinus canicula]|uniref:S-acyl fatty acid synthase thioesterase, medium chain isoform X2 n=1 Tax=Scyliorhinus canicula TaxID=7830 RepID=UPI0018F3B9C7|nr:S-acyl fatty acid synthase thioesterase, medium chain isoform X2 [Scyliorhinus canicula]
MGLFRTEGKDTKVFLREMDKVANCLYRRPQALYRLICFPWAGGGSIHYAQWGKHFNNSIEDKWTKLLLWRWHVSWSQTYPIGKQSLFDCMSLSLTWRQLKAVSRVPKQEGLSAQGEQWAEVNVYSIRLPGREIRSKEPHAQNLQQLIEEISSTLLPSLKEKPFAFFGHSLGAYLSFATAEYLKRIHGLEPVHLFVSGASAPHSPVRYPIQKRADLPDDKFLEWMASIGGTPSEILANKDILQLFVPVLKADLRLVESIRYEKPPNKLFSCSISSFDGKQDVPHDLEAWNDLTSGEFTTHKLPGGHFYLKEPDNEKFLVAYITKHLETAEVHYL